MSNWYVRSGASGTANGAEWTDAYLTLAAAQIASNTAPGDVIWVSDDHAELTVGNVVLYSANATQAAPLYVICANHTSGNLPPNVNTDLETTANVSAGGLLSFGNGYFYTYGVNFHSGSGNTTACNITVGGATGYGFCKFANSQFYIDGTIGTAQFVLGGGQNVRQIFKGCQFYFVSNANHFTMDGGYPTFSDCSLPNNALTYLFVAASGGGSQSQVLMKRCDISKLGTGSTLLYSFFATAQFNQFLVMEDCLVNSAVLVVNSALCGPATYASLVRCFSPWQDAYYDGFGGYLDSNTVYRTGGWSDGTHSKSRNIITYGNTSPSFPFSPLTSMTKWNAVVGQSLNATIYGTWNGAAVPNNNVIWLEVEYLANATSQKTTSNSSGMSQIAILPTQTSTALNHDTGSTWVGGGANTFSTSVTFTPLQPGLIRAYVKVGQASLAAANLYIDPVVYITDTSNNLLSTTPISYDTSYGTISESGPIGGGGGLIISGI